MSYAHSFDCVFYYPCLHDYKWLMFKLVPYAFIRMILVFLIAISANLKLRISKSSLCQTMVDPHGVTNLMLRNASYFSEWILLFDQSTNCLKKWSWQKLFSFVSDSNQEENETEWSFQTKFLMVVRIPDTVVEPMNHNWRRGTNAKWKIHCRLSGD